MVLPTIHGNESYGTPNIRNVRSVDQGEPEISAEERQLRLDEARKAEEAVKERLRLKEEEEKKVEAERMKEELEDNRNRPWFGRNNQDRSAKISPEKMASRVLEKKLKFIRLVGLKEHINEKGQVKVGTWICPSRVNLLTLTNFMG